jgi:protein-tyrosine phosphatase
MKKIFLAFLLLIGFYTKISPMTEFDENFRDLIVSAYNLPDLFGKIKDFIVGDNFRIVCAGKCYRSKQLSTSSLEKYLRMHDIKVIINLCSEEESNEPWHILEVLTAKACNVEVIDIYMEKNEMPKKETLLRLLKVFKDHKDKSVLIHCSWGIDRTGLIVFLWKFLVEGKTKEQATRAFKDFVFPRIWWNHWEKNRPFVEAFVKLCPERTDGFEDWVTHQYPH